jgi:hypothetical protein
MPLEKISPEEILKDENVKPETEEVTAKNPLIQPPPPQMASGSEEPLARRGEDQGGGGQN